MGDTGVEVEEYLIENQNLKDIDILNKIKKCMKSSAEFKKSSTENCIRLYFSQ